MKTALFYMISRDSRVAKQILSDLVELFTLDDVKRSACIEGVLKIASKSMTANQATDVIEEIASNYSIDVIKTRASIQVLQFFLEYLTDDNFKNATTDDLCDDLLDCFNLIDIEPVENSRQVFSIILDCIRDKSLVDNYKNIINRKEAASELFPSLKSFGTSVELRPIIGKHFRIGDTVDAGYDPDIQGVVPVIWVKLRTDSGVIDEFSFQATEEDIEALIQELRASQIVISRLQEYMHINTECTKDTVRGEK